MLNHIKPALDHPVYVWRRCTMTYRLLDHTQTQTGRLPVSLFMSYSLSVLLL